MRPSSTTNRNCNTPCDSSLIEHAKQNSSKVLAICVPSTQCMCNMYSRWCISISTDSSAHTMIIMIYVYLPSRDTPPHTRTARATAPSGKPPPALPPPPPETRRTPSHSAPTPLLKRPMATPKKGPRVGVTLCYYFSRGLYYFGTIRIGGTTTPR